MVRMMAGKRHWLGNRLLWKYVNLPDRGKCRTAKVPFNKKRLPWLRSNSYLTAAIFHAEHTLELFDTEDSDEIFGMHPICRFDETKISLHALQDIIPSCMVVEGLYTGLLGVDLADKHRNDFTANDFLRFWQTRHVSGWWVIEKSGVGVAITRDYCCMHDQTVHAVQISSDGLSIYKFGLNRCSDLADQDRIVYKRISEASIDSMLRLFTLDSAIEVRLAIRFYRTAIYALAYEYEELPF